MNPEENTTPMGTDEASTDAPAPDAMPAEGAEAPAMDTPAEAPVEAPVEGGDDMGSDDADASEDAGM